MTKDEALKLALEALEKSVATCFDRYSHEQVMSRPEHFINQVITAIKQARALDKKADNARELGLDYKPVTTLFGSLPVYDTPPAAQRQWVGLTDDEMYLNCPNWLSQEQCKVWIQQIEAKLKAKNSP